MSSNGRSRRQQQRRSSNVQLVERQPDRELELEETLQRVEAMLWEARNSPRGQLTKSLAWDESEALGIPSQFKRINNLSEKEYKDTLCKAYINMPWIAACIDARVLRLVSGTWELEPTCEDADESVKEEILELLLYINDDEDLMQMIYSYGLDVMIYGEGFIEIVREKDKDPNSKPTELHKIDCQTMTYDIDEHGNIKAYKQLLSNQTEPITLDPYRVMRTWFPSPESNKKALSPIAKLMNSAMLYEQMMEWARSFFKKGARPPFSFEHPGDKRKADEFLLWLKENFTGKQNAHIPLMTYDGVKMQYAPSGPIELDFLKGLEWVRQETLSNLQTSPANIGIVESANLGSGTGDSQSKTFLNNAVKPLDRLIMEKFNYAIIRKGFNTNQWKLVLHPASYADDEAIATLEDKRIRNGSSTPNEARVAQGKAKYENMGDTPVIVTTKEVTALSTLDNLEHEHNQTTELQAAQAQAQVELTQAQVEKLKNPPEPPPAPVQPLPSPVPSEPEKGNETPQEHYTNDLHHALQQVNDVLVRADEHLRFIRNEDPGFVTVQEAREWFENVLPKPTAEDREIPVSTQQDQGDTNEEHSMARSEESAPISEDRTDRTENSEDGEPTAKRSYRRSGRTELNRWRARALFDARAGRGLRAFESDILPVRRIHGIQAQLERVTSEEAIRVIFAAAAQSETIAEKVTKGWRPPSEAQIALEKKLTASIKTFIHASKITRDGIVLPDEQAHDHLQEALYDALVAANHEGTQIMHGAQESIVSAAKNLAGHAVQVITDIIAQLKEKAQSIIDAVLGDDRIDPGDVEQVIEDQVEAWAADYSEMVAQTEMHTAVEGAVLSELQASGAKKMRWVASPDACDDCQHLAENDPVDVDAGEFEGGITPPGHPRCRCEIEMVDEE